MTHHSDIAHYERSRHVCNYRTKQAIPIKARQEGNIDSKDVPITCPVAGLLATFVRFSKCLTASTPLL